MSLFCCIFYKKARSSIYPYAYHSTADISSIERPLMSATTATANLYSTQQQNAMPVTSMTMQQSPMSTFGANLSTNQETALAHVCVIVKFFFFSIKNSQRKHFSSYLLFLLS